MVVTWVSRKSSVYWVYRELVLWYVCAACVVCFEVSHERCIVSFAICHERCIVLWYVCAYQFVKARQTLSLPQTSRANPVQCCSTNKNARIKFVNVRSTHFITEKIQFICLKIQCICLKIQCISPLNSVHLFSFEFSCLIACLLVESRFVLSHGVATISRLLQIVDLFCRI